MARCCPVDVRPARRTNERIRRGCATSSPGWAFAWSASAGCALAPSASSPGSVSVFVSWGSMATKNRRADYRSSVDRVPGRLVRYGVERAMGIEPTSLAWEAKVMAIIRRPRTRNSMRVFAVCASGRRGCCMRKCIHCHSHCCIRRSGVCSYRIGKFPEGPAMTTVTKRRSDRSGVRDSWLVLLVRDGGFTRRRNRRHR